MKRTDAPDELLVSVLQQPFLVAYILMKVETATDLFAALCTCNAWAQEEKNIREELWEKLAKARFSEAVVCGGWLARKPWKTRYRVLLHMGRKPCRRRTSEQIRQALDKYECAIEVRARPSSEAEDQTPIIVGHADAASGVASLFDGMSRFAGPHDGFQLQASFGSASTGDGIGVRFTSPFAGGLPHPIASAELSGVFIVTVYVTREDGAINLLLEFELNLANGAGDEPFFAPQARAYNMVDDEYNDDDDDDGGHGDEAGWPLKGVQEVEVEGELELSRFLKATNLSNFWNEPRAKVDVVRENLQDAVFLPSPANSAAFVWKNDLNTWSIGYAMDLSRKRDPETDEYGEWRLDTLELSLGFHSIDSEYMRLKPEQKTRVVSRWESSGLDAEKMLELLESDVLDWVGS